MLASLNEGLPCRPDYTLDQPFERYTEIDHETWRTLYARQAEMLRGRVCEEFLRGLDRLDMDHDRVPDFARLNARLSAATGWKIVAVPGLVPDLVFFEHLANRRFPATWWIRRPEQLDYLQEPDAFHDLFGHVPLLINPIFADYLQAYGIGGLKAWHLDALPFLARLYWYTVEFGLIRTPGGLRIYGSGIVSSKSESIYALDSPSPNRLGFDLRRIMRTRYRIDTFQKTYFVINGFDQLFAATQADFTPHYEALKGQESLAAGAVLTDDVVIQRGNRDGWSESDDA
jgi:phenylalanine-4-hydroxylase